MQLLYHSLGQGLLRMVDDVVDGAEVVLGLQDVVYPDGSVAGADRGRLEDEPGLVERQPASLDAVGVVGELDLDLVVYAALGPGRFLFPKAREQGAVRLSLRVRAGGLFRVRGYVPGLPREESAGHAALSAVVPNAPLGNVPDFSYLGCGKKLHRAAPPPFFIGKN